MCECEGVGTVYVCVCSTCMYVWGKQLVCVCVQCVLCGCKQCMCLECVGVNSTYMCGCEQLVCERSFAIKGSRIAT